MTHEDETKPDLTVDELRELLRLNSAELVRDLYDAAHLGMTTEVAHRERVDVKARHLTTMTLVGIWGFSLCTVWRLPSEPIVVALSLVTLGTGLVATGYGLAAGRARRGAYSAVSEHAVFSAESLADDDATGHRRFLIPHLWDLARKNLAVDQDKVRLVRCGQAWLALFTVALAGTVATLLLTR